MRIPSSLCKRIPCDIHDAMQLFHDGPVLGDPPKLGKPGPAEAQRDEGNEQPPEPLRECECRPQPRSPPYHRATAVGTRRSTVHHAAESGPSLALDVFSPPLHQQAVKVVSRTNSMKGAPERDTEQSGLTPRCRDKIGGRCPGRSVCDSGTRDADCGAARATRS